MSSHSGTMIEDLKAAGARAIERHLAPADDLYRRVDEAMQMARIYREAFSILLIERCMQHLTDARDKSRYAEFDSGDRAAWERMEAIRDWILNGPPCARCGQPRGAHAHLGSLCPTPKGSPLLDLFRVSRFREKRCEANVWLSADGCSAIECGLPLLPGMDFCKDHAE